MSAQTFSSDRSLELRAIQGLQISRGIEHIVEISHICRKAHERNELAEISGVDNPVKPLEYLASLHVSILNFIRHALETGRLESAAEIVRNVGPLFETMSHLNAAAPESWDAILTAADELAQSDPHSLVRGVVLVHFARRERVRNEWPLARTFAERAITWCRDHPNRTSHVLALEIDAHESLGEVFRSMGGAYLESAAIEFERGLVAASKLQDHETRRNAELRLHDRRGYVLYLEERHEEARIEFLTSVALHGRPSTNPSELSRTCNNLAKVSAALGRRTIARLYLERSLRIKRDVDDIRGQAICHHEIGLLFLADGDFTRAIDSLEKSRLMKLDIDDRHGVGLSLMELGFANDTLRTHNPDSEDYFREQAQWLLTEAEMYLTHDSVQERRVRLRLGKPV